MDPLNKNDTQLVMPFALPPVDERVSTPAAERDEPVPAPAMHACNAARVAVQCEAKFTMLTMLQCTHEADPF